MSRYFQLSVLIAIVVLQAHSQSYYNAEPMLISESKIDIPLAVLKKGIHGIVGLQLHLDKDGVVEKCIVTSGVSHLLDSIAKQSLMKSKFSPSIENGTAVASILDVEISFSTDSLINRFYGIKPILTGRLTNKESNKPLANVLVKVCYSDTTQDTAISIPFSIYSNLICKIGNQSFSNNIFSTKTDSMGIFSFHLLPSGHVNIEINAPGFQSATSQTFISEQTQTRINIAISEQIINENGHEIVIYGKKESSTSKVDIEKQEHSTGLTHSLHNIILSQTAIRRSSKSESAILVRSGSPYDNLYLISGVPFYAPYHFAGFAFGEIDGLMISALNNIDININDIAGRYPLVSGVLIKASPEIVRPANEKLIPRPELVIDFGNRSADLLLSLKTRNRKKRAVQVGFSGANFQLLKWMEVHYGLSDNAQLGIGFPNNFGNVTLTAEAESDRFNYSAFSWFAWDSYDTYLSHVKKTIPWGMVSCNFSPRNSEKWNLSCGGSRQYFAEGKKVGFNSYLNTTYLRNASASLDYKCIQNKNMSVSIEGGISYKDWCGKTVERNNYSPNVELSRYGEEIETYLHGMYDLNIKALTFRTNLLLFTKIFDKEPVFVFDPGFSLCWDIRRLTLGLNVGKITSFPDFRGLPDEQFRKKRLNIQTCSIPIKFQNQKIKLGIQPYLRIQNSVPVMDPLIMIWDTKKNTALKAIGIESDIELNIAEWITFYSNLSISDAERNRNDCSMIYEWESKLTSTSGVHLVFFKDMLHTYFNGHIRSGNYYYDFSTGGYSQLPLVCTNDLSIQIRYPKIKDRFYTRYDGYITFHNIFNRTTIRDYYWNEKMEKVKIVSDGIFLTFGLKAAIRF